MNKGYEDKTDARVEISVRCCTLKPLYCCVVQAHRSLLKQMGTKGRSVSANYAPNEAAVPVFQEHRSRVPRIF